MQPPQYGSFDHQQTSAVPSPSSSLGHMPLPYHWGPIPHTNQNTRTSVGMMPTTPFLPNGQPNFHFNGHKGNHSPVNHNGHHNYGYPSSGAAHRATPVYYNTANGHAANHTTTYSQPPPLPHGPLHSSVAAPAVLTTKVGGRTSPFSPSFSPYPPIARAPSSSQLNTTNIRVPAVVGVGKGTSATTLSVTHQQPQPHQSSSVVLPFVVPALTPSLTSNTAVIKPSHQILLVRPLPAFLTEDEAFLEFAKNLVLPEDYEEESVDLAAQLLLEGEEAVRDFIREKQGVNERNGAKTAEGEANKKTDEITPINSRLHAIRSRLLREQRQRHREHCNFLPFAAKVIRKSVISAVTASQRRIEKLETTTQLSSDCNTAAQESGENEETIQIPKHQPLVSDEAQLMPNNKCFCEDGYGFLLFATEEAGLTFLRAVERLSNAQQTKEKEGTANKGDAADITLRGGGGGEPSHLRADRPPNFAVVRADYDEISAIRRRIHEEAYADCYGDDEDEGNAGLLLSNASFSSSISSSSRDSATSFDSNSSFGSLASEEEDNEKDEEELLRLRTDETQATTTGVNGDHAEVAAPSPAPIPQAATVVDLESVKKLNNLNNSTSLNRFDCDHCTHHRRMYRVYYRAKQNRMIDGVRIACPVVAPESVIDLREASSEEEKQQQKQQRRPATFTNGLVNASKEQISEMRELFNKCLFTTTISAAGADGTVAAKTRTKVLPLFPLSVAEAEKAANSWGAAKGECDEDNTATESKRTRSFTPSELVSAAESAIVSSLAAAVPLEKRTVAVYRPVLIDFTQKESPSVSFLGASSSEKEGGKSPVLLRNLEFTTAPDDLSRLAVELIKQRAATRQSSAALLANSTINNDGANGCDSRNANSPPNTLLPAVEWISTYPAGAEKRTRFPFPRTHHTHHRHCLLHRAAAMAKRAERRKTKAIQTRLSSRAQQAPHVVSVSVSVNVAAAGPLSFPLPAAKLSSNNNNNSAGAVAPIITAGSSVLPSMLHVPSSVVVSPCIAQKAIIGGGTSFALKNDNATTSQKGSSASVHTVDVQEQAPLALNLTTAASTAPISSDAVDVKNKMVNQTEKAATAKENNGVILLEGATRFRYNPYGTKSDIISIAASKVATATAGAKSPLPLSESTIATAVRKDVSVPSTPLKLKKREASVSAAEITTVPSTTNTTLATPSKSTAPTKEVSVASAPIAAGRAGSSPQKTKTAAVATVTSASLAPPLVSTYPSSLESTGPSSAPRNGNPNGSTAAANAGGGGGVALSDLLPAWAQPANVNHASAKVRTLFNMSKTKRF